MTPRNFGLRKVLSAARRPLDDAVRGRVRRARTGGVIIALIAVTGAAAQEATPANTLMDMRRQFGACLAEKTIGPAGSRVTIVFMMKRDGSILGKPRITYSHLEGDEEARRRFLDDAERAVGSCLPFKVTPSLGRAIAGRMFSITIGAEKPQRGA
jgi:hypothetical protein